MLFQKTKFDIFNTLRGIAIFCVFFVHFMCGSKEVRPDVLYPGLTIIPAWGAMWIFFMLSGYLLGKGFFNGKYNLSFQGIKKFLANRFVRTVPYYLFFISVVFVFQDPLFFVSNSNVLNLFLLKYNGVGGICGIGALWFVSTIAQLYLLAPIIYTLFKKLNKNQSLLVFVILILAGGVVRLVERHLGLNWFECTYTFSLSNLDIFSCGIILNKFTNSPDSKVKMYLRPISFFALLSLIVFLAYDWTGMDLAVYNCFKYYFPSVYIVIIGCIIYAFDYQGKERINPLSVSEIKKSPIRIVEALGVISFSFYLFHSNILVSVLKIFSTLGGTKFIFYGFFLSFVLSILIATFCYFTIEKHFNRSKR